MATLRLRSLRFWLGSQRRQHGRAVAPFPDMRWAYSYRRLGEAQVLKED
jgi:hypothetical protein